MNKLDTQDFRRRIESYQGELSRMNFELLDFELCNQNGLNNELSDVGCAIRLTRMALRILVEKLDQQTKEKPVLTLIKEA